MLLAIVVIAAVAAAALVVWAVPLERSGAGTQDANPDAGHAVIHDGADNLHASTWSAPGSAISRRLIR